MSETITRMFVILGFWFAALVVVAVLALLVRGIVWIFQNYKMVRK